MKRTHRCRPPGLPPNCGSILIEVVVAVLVLGTLVVPLATRLQSMVDRAAGAGMHLAGVVGDDQGDAVGPAWEWGNTVAMAEWGPGPELTVHLRDRDLPELLMGVWSDGWFLGEYADDVDGSVLLRRPVWEELAGRDVVLRVRAPEGDWGPPWRTVVPDAWGDVVVVDPNPEAATGDREGSADLRSVVHVPVLATPEVCGKGVDGPLEVGALGLPLFLRASTPGLAVVRVGERQQTWTVERLRTLDVYF